MMSDDTYNFSADADQFLKLILKNFYTKKEIFLREIISNASDALDRIKLQPLSDESKLQIKIIPDKLNHTLTIQDTGIGMTKQELITNLGTIAKSEFKTNPDLSTIGQFGIGFYSAFLVADKVTVISRSEQEEKQYKWESTGNGTFHISEEKDSESLVSRGTRITLQMRKNNLQFLEEKTIRRIVKKYSLFISYPIYLRVECESEDGITKKQFHHLNRTPPLWIRKPETITKEEYNCFLKSVFYDWENALGVKHFSIEGQLNFKALLFVPANPEFCLFDEFHNKIQKMKLCVKRVLVIDGCDELIPEYLNFIKGVVDSDDLPLRISRDSLLQNKIFRVMKKNIVKKCLEMIQEITEKDFESSRFYYHYSHHIKLGICQDSMNRHKLAEFLRYNSSRSGVQMISLKPYVERMKEDQKEIYFVTGDSIASVINSPFTRGLNKKGYEVLYLVQPIDECVVEHLKYYHEKKLRNCSKEGFEVYSEKNMITEQREAYQGLCTIMKEILGSKVDTILVGTKMNRSSCALFTNEHGWSAGLIRTIKAQALRDPSFLSCLSSKITMEVNPDDEIMKELKRRSNQNHIDETFIDTIWLLRDTALLASGIPLENPSELANRIHRMLISVYEVKNPFNSFDKDD